MVRCYLCQLDFKNERGKHIHEAVSLKHFIRKMEANDPNRLTLDDFFGEVKNDERPAQK